jgi:protein-L-isoaspartate(D-aspartate) O-methyltransferase
MTEALISGREPPLPKVLEIGTGCGYQTAILAAFARHVYSIERVQPLIERARKTLRELRINNVSLRYSDGSGGWPSQAPFQGIIVTAAPETVPPGLLEQLDEGGRLIIPLGSAGHQSLVCFTRHGDEFRRDELLAVSFVPLVQGKET